MFCRISDKRGEYVDEKIPELYETEEIELEKKIIYQKWDIEEIGFYWLIAELDKKKSLAFGYANLNNDYFAEWGYINLRELLANGAEMDRSWAPCTFDEPMKKIKEYRRGFYPR